MHFKILHKIEGRGPFVNSLGLILYDAKTKNHKEAGHDGACL
jgi:hypothetical protein